MVLIFSGLLSIILALIFLEDIKFRAISLPSLVSLYLISSYFYWANSFPFEGFQNLLLSLVLILVLWSYSHFILHQRFIDHAFGLGDILVLVPISFLLPVQLFLYCIISSSLTGLITGKITKNHDAPFAGLLCLSSLFLFWLNG